jgi:hypothetical protein
VADSVNFALAEGQVFMQVHVLEFSANQSVFKVNIRLDAVFGVHGLQITYFGLLIQLALFEINIELVGKVVVQVGVELRFELVRVGTLSNQTRAHQYEVRGVDAIKETHGFAGVDDHEDLFVLPFYVHFIVHFCKVL